MKLFLEWIAEKEREYTEKDIQGVQYVPAEIVERYLEIEDDAYPDFMKVANNNIGTYPKDKITPNMLKTTFFMCSGDLYFKLAKDWIIIACDHSDYVEVTEFAKKKSASTTLMLNSVTKFLSQFGGKKVEVDARDSTSYKLLKTLERNNKIKIHRENPWTWRDNRFDVPENERLLPVTMWKMSFTPTWDKE
jgi:hypothetical protein